MQPASFGMTVRHAYDQWARRYDHDRNRTRDLNCKRFAGADLPLAGARIFEAGCGTGLITTWMAADAASIVAMDFSEGMLEQARAHGWSDSVRFLRGDLRDAWPAEDGSMDLVVITLVLEHLESLQPVFREARRVLKAGGALYISELHPGRQSQGRQARFTPQDSPRELRIPAWQHSIQAFLDTAGACGFRLQKLAEAGDDQDDTPRLLQLWLTARS